jgi:methionyl-tRNA formyltransferase
MKIAILTTKDEWFEKWVIQLACELKSAIYFHHNNIESFDILFILGYHSIIPKNILKKK